MNRFGCRVSLTQLLLLSTALCALVAAPAKADGAAALPQIKPEAVGFSSEGLERLGAVSHLFDD